MSHSTHVVVLGAGNAALCAGLAARERGAEVTVLECSSKAERGGNTAFTAGAMRVAYSGVEDLVELMPDLTEAELQNTDFGSYPADQFLDDLARVSEFRTDPDLAGTLARESFPTLKWMREQGVRFVPIFGRQAFQVDGKFTFWGGLTVETSGGGGGLVEALTRSLERKGGRIEYECRAISLIADDAGIKGVRVRRHGVSETIEADAIVLATGGFQANVEWRARYLGTPWDLAKVRGSKYNTGDGLRMALEIGASPAGNWTGCHAVGWELNAPEFGDLAVGDHFQKHSYPFGVMVNADGRRFVDEGADFRNYTYAKYGRAILEQPRQFAWQVFDSKVLHLLRDEYHIRQVTKVRADSLEELAARLEGVDAEDFLKNVREYNDAVEQATTFNPNVKDGRATSGLDINKTNWANTIDSPPFEAYAVTCGITFTFGGLRINTQGEVLNTDMQPIPGLFAAGEIVGGVFYFNYPGGSGLTNGAVFGRIAGYGAAAARQRDRATA